MIRDQKSDGVTGIPVLSDIPILGNLFKTTEKTSTRTELLVLIKPSVVQNQEEVRTVTNELRRKLPGLTSLLAEPESIGNTRNVSHDR